MREVILSVMLILTSISAFYLKRFERAEWCAHFFELKTKYDKCKEKGVEVMK